MNDDRKIFLTTTLPYVNSVPHIGHAFEFLIGDALSRYFKQSGCDVRFNVGLDEHGLKVYTKATELRITPQEHISNLTAKWLEFCSKFHIGFEIFKTRTNADIL